MNCARFSTTGRQLGNGSSAAVGRGGSSSSSSSCAKLAARLGLGGGARRRRCARVATAAAPATTVAAAPATTVSLLPEVVPVAAQVAEQRSKLQSELLSGGLVFLSAGDLVPRNGDVYHQFRPSSDFLYATGLDDMPGWGCLFDADSGRMTLVAPRVPEEAAIWTGPTPPIERVAAEAGADDAVYADELAALVARRGGSRLLHVLEGGERALEAAGVDVGGEDGGGGPRVTADFLRGALSRSRARKTRAEIACLLQANRVSAAAHEAIWERSSRAFASSSPLFEYQLEAAFASACCDSGLRRMGYPSIVGAGANAGVLHYDRNGSRVASPQDLVLVDAGAEFRGYTADITRTFPAGGAFREPRRRAVYELTLAVQLEALKGVREGADWQRDVEAPARRLMLEGLRDMGLVRGDVDDMLQSGVDRVFCPHGLGHHLGLAVHDVSEHGPVPKGVPLEAGFVVTVEPGVYFMPLLLRRAMEEGEGRGKEGGDKSNSGGGGAGRFLVPGEIAHFEGLGGVRIEDNVAILPRPTTAEGAASGGGGGAAAAAAAGAAEVLNLTEATGRAPKRPEEIEAAMAAAVTMAARRP